jgi:RNA polymerase sigma-70 factor (ECF subfamily)
MEVATTKRDLGVATGRHRAELVAYCRRMLGSPIEAEDAAQETLLRAWRASERFEGRSSLRTWLFRIATNVCIDTLGRAKRQPVPVEEPIEPSAACEQPDLCQCALASERLRLAVMATIGTLPPRQRAVFLLRDALSWRTSDVAELLGTTVASVNSALQRAHAALGAIEPESVPDPADAQKRELVTRYLAAFADDNIDTLVALSTLEWSACPRSSCA